MAEILFSGCRSGRYPLEYARKHPDDRITVHAYDSYQARKVSEDNGRRRRNVEVVCTAGLPEGAVYSEAFYYATTKLVSAELELETLQDIYLHLAEGARSHASANTTFRAGSTVGSVLPTDSGQALHGSTVREKMGKLQVAFG